MHRSRSSTWNTWCGLFLVFAFRNHAKVIHEHVRRVVRNFGERCIRHAPHFRRGIHDSLVSGTRNVRKDFEVTKLRWSVWVPPPAGMAGGFFRQMGRRYGSSVHTVYGAKNGAESEIRILLARAALRWMESFKKIMQKALFGW